MHREAWFCLYCRYKAIKQNNLTKHVAAARNRPNPAAATTATTFATKTLEEKRKSRIKMLKMWIKDCFEENLSDLKVVAELKNCSKDFYEDKNNLIFFVKSLFKS